jgi:predicted AAA+ superfamily ATPase
MKREILLEWNPWWVGEFKPRLVGRELEAQLSRWTERKEIVAVLGARRAGKTELLRLLIAGLLRKVPKENVFFMKADDERVGKEGLLAEALAACREAANPKGRTYVFIDEIQEVPDWSESLKRMYDLERDVKFFISGSNIALGRKELSERLAGRIAYFDLYPFSFREMLAARGLEAPASAGEAVAIKPALGHHLLAYLESGGFPEVVLEKDAGRRAQLLRFYYDTILFRDVVRRHGVRNPQKLDAVASYFLQNVANKANFGRIGKAYSLSPDSVSEYASFLQEAFLVFQVPLHSHSAKRSEINPKKAYCVDNGLRNVMGLRFSEDAGRLAENAVFVELMRRNGSNPLCRVFYWSDGRFETDFAVKCGREISLCQVCWDFSGEARQREIDGLLAAMKALGAKEGTIITKDCDEEMRLRGRKIRVVPLHLWLLGF